MTLEQLAAEVRAILKRDPGPRGRDEVRARLEAALRDPAFVETHAAGVTADRQLLYEDPELGFCILSHSYSGVKASPPHDHGPSWAIYGQAAGETDMTDYALVSPAQAGAAGKARPLRTYRLSPGMAHLYNEGDLHAVASSGPMRLVRIEGRNLQKVKRERFEAV